MKNLQSVFVQPLHVTDRTFSLLSEPYASKSFLSVDDVAQILNQTRITTYHQIYQGQIPGAIKIGHKWRISRAIFERAILDESRLQDHQGRQGRNSYTKRETIKDE